jgi:hypothetical protein
MYKLSKIEEEELEFNVLLINSVLEVYKLAFHLNKILPFQLYKSINPLYIKNINNRDFEFYKYENEIENVFWYLIPNKITIKKEGNTSNTIIDNIDEQVYFITEYKKFDYVLKFVDTNINIIDFLKKINQINNLSTTIIADKGKIKNKKTFKILK